MTREAGKTDSGALPSKRKIPGGKRGIHVNQYVYNTENKQVQVYYADTTAGTPTWTRLSDEFYHLDGSRMWEGIFDETGNGLEGIQGQFTFDAFNSVRLTHDENSFWIVNIFANGRRIAALQQFLWTEPGGCSISPWTRLKYITYPAIVANFGLLLTPIILVILIRGWFFDKSWRRKRAKNTFIVFMVFVLVFGLLPAQGGAQERLPDDMHLWMWTHVKERLARMYGGEDQIPHIASAAKFGIEMYPPASGQRYILRDSLFWFAPDKMKKGFDSIFPRAAENDVTPPARRQGVAPPARWQGKDAGGPPALPKAAKANLHLPWMASAQGVGQAFLPVHDSSSSDVPRPTSDVRASEGVSHDAPLYQRILDAFNDVLGVPTAQALTWPYTPDTRNRIDFFHTDHLGSTRLVTDKNGRDFEWIDYLPFGEIFNDAGPVGANEYDKYPNKYTGQMWDFRTGLYYYGARYYDAQLGRFTQADTRIPDPFDGQAFNRLSYALNNPYRFTDPSGHETFIFEFQAFLRYISSFFNGSGSASNYYSDSAPGHPHGDGSEIPIGADGGGSGGGGFKLPWGGGGGSGGGGGLDDWWHNVVGTSHTITLGDIFGSGGGNGDSSSDHGPKQNPISNPSFTPPPQRGFGDVFNDALDSYADFFNNNESLATLSGYSHGLFRGAGGMVKGVATMVIHPINTVTSVGGALGDLGGMAVYDRGLLAERLTTYYDDFANMSSDEYGLALGEGVGNIAMGWGMGEAANAAGQYAKSISFISCFVAGTLVATAEGPRPIEDVEVGDQVLAWDETTGANGLYHVEQTFRHLVDQTVKVHLADGSSVQTTEEHPFWTRNTWTPAIELNAATPLTTSWAGKAAVSYVEVVNGPKEVYNFTVEKVHTYYVSTDNLLVHNTCKVNFKVPKPGTGGKVGATNIPSWAEGSRPMVGQSGKSFASDLMNSKYGKGNWSTRDREFSQLKKYADRHFMDPKE